MVVDARMSLARLFVLIDSFEQDMRGLVEKYVLDHLTEDIALGPEYAQVAALRSADVGEESVSIVHYLYLRQCYDVLNRHRAKLPEEVATELRANTSRLDTLVPIRNRVMHGRPLKMDDPETAVSALQGFTTRHWDSTKQTLARLAADSSWEPAFETLPLPGEKVLHNLPFADYDETGLVGRGQDVAKLKALLQRRREPIITITGEGGIGKTALALEVAYELVDDKDTPYDCVLWVSLKREKFNELGVRDIFDAIRDITGAAEHLGKVIDRSFSGSIKELSEALQGLDALVIVDNLESVQGSEVLSMYDALPDSVTYLFTSRMGIGEIERRYPVRSLSLADAMLLFKKFAARRGQRQLASLKQDVLTDVLNRLRYSPLAIRWYILSVEAGQEPASRLRDQRELLDFCVRNVYEALTGEAQSALAVLYSLDRSATFDELAVLAELPIDDLRRAAQELSRGSLIIHEPDPNGGLASKLGLSAAARLFLPGQDRMGLSSTEILHRERAFVRAAEGRRADEASRRLAPGVVRVRGPQDEPTAHLLGLALAKSRRGDIVAAQGYIDRARALNPDFWEVDRVDAFLASTQGHMERAASLYKAALGKADSDESRAVICHFFGGHLARSMHEVELARPYAEEAHRVLGGPDTALSLGNLKVWSGEFASGQELLEVAAENAAGKTRLIALTAVVDSWRRWADSLLELHRPLEALDKAYAGFSVGNDVVEEGFLDLKLAGAVLEAATTALRAASTQGVPRRPNEAKILAILRGITKHAELFSGTRGWSKLLAQVTRHLRGEAPQSETAHLGRVLVQGDRASAVSSRSSVASSAALVGEVLSWVGRYGFIKHPDYPNNLFFHRGALQESGREVDLKGAVVSFEIEEEPGEDNPTARAKSVRVLR